LSLPLIIQQIAKVDARILELRERCRHAADDGSREFFRVQAGHFQILRADLEAMRITLENIQARAKALSDE
jgi:hypothetical protein